MFAAMRHAYIPLEAKTYNTYLYTPTANQTLEDPDYNFNQIFLDMEDERFFDAEDNQYWFPEQVDQGLYVQNEITLHTQITFQAYCIGAGAFWGQFIFMFFFGTGIISIPLSNIIAWADRPRPMTEGEFKKEKDRMAKQVDYLLKSGRKLYDEKTAMDAKYASSRGLFSKYN